MKPWMKFAILGSTYARALQNAATRGGRALAPAMEQKLTQMNAQPLARLQPGLGQMFREHATGGALTPTPQQQNLQQMLHRTPWATDEHSGLRGGSEFAVNRFNQLLDETGRSHNAPAGQPTSHQAIQQAFGAPQQQMKDPSQVRQLPPGAYRLPGGFSVPEGRAAFELQDDTGRGSTRVGPAPGSTARRGAPVQQGTYVGAAPAPRPGQGGAAQRYAPGSDIQHTYVNRQSSPLARQELGGPHVGAPPPAQQLQRPSSVPHAPVGRQAATMVIRKTGAALPTAVGLGIPLAVGGGMLAAKPGIQANVRALTEGGSTQERDVSGELPAPALNHANAIHQALLSHGLDPASVRMGIDAPPGSGKTTLARALAQQAGMKHYGLDWEPGNWWKSTIGLGRNVESMPRAPKAGEVLEHYMLGRTYDPELFDAMVHIHRDPEVLKQQLQHRGHGAYIGDMMDLQKSLGVADLGFNTLGGETIDLGEGVQMKLRPREGWGNAVDQRLMQLGIDPTGLSRHEKLLSLHAGKRETGAGWTPYVKNPLSTGETIALGASVPLGIMAARALRARPV